jgi:hypothetical protein
MTYDLEYRTAEPEYRSWGEQRIAGVLDQYGVPYEYERPVLVVDRSKPRIWYPDLWLPDASVAIEYFGMAGEPDYDRGLERKTRVYAENGIGMVPVYRQQLGRELPDYLMGGIEQILHGRYERFQTAYRHSSPGTGYAH